MNKLLTQQSGLVAALAIIIVVADLLFIALPAARRTADTNAAVAASKTRTAALEQNLTTLRALQAAQAKQTEDFTRLFVALPTKPFVDEIFISLDSIARRTGVALDSATPGKESATHVPVDIVVKGPYSGIVDFMAALTTNLRPATVETMAVTGSTQEVSAKLRLNYVVAGRSSQ